MRNVLVLAVLLLAGCVITRHTYIVDGVRYSNEDEAMVAMMRSEEAQVASFEVRPTSVDANVLILIPNLEALLKTSATAYHARALEASYVTAGRCVQKSRAFTNVETRAVSDPAKEASEMAPSVSAVIYPQRASPTLITWYMLKKNAQPQEIKFNPALIGPARRNAVIDGAVALYTKS